ncbi:uncharacterized protein LOC135343251 [Halichondria panicea]|uniref:uncharacterized protein LOC135343251 n=1 Tax=Halichondria panicea TaxID=6063 RepID=UPI00312BCB46
MDSTNSSSRDHTKPVMRKKCKYQVRWFYSKGAFLVLLWTTLVSATFWSYTTNLGQKFLKKSYGEHWYIVLIPLSSLTFIVIPLLGWLADAKLGNYRVFKFNCFSLLIATIICGIHILYGLTLKSIALQYTSAVILVLVDAVGTAGAVVSITTALQLGLDQMPDASSTNMSSFISWFAFSIFFGFWIADWLLSTLLYCVPLSESTKVQMFSLFPVTCTVIICSSMFLLAPKWLTIEPKSPKTLKIIYQVFKFAAKHKAPIYRSALTYWEEDVPSRLDLGKTKYSGPFSTEQVEDVKTFLRILMMSFPIFVILTAGGNILVSFVAIDQVVIFNTTKYHLNPNITECISSIVYNFSFNPWWSGIVTTVVYEFAMYPLIRNKVPSSIRQIGSAALLILLLNALNLAMQFCPYVWASVFFTGILTGFGLVLLINGILEFVCAQSPYNMRGLLTAYIIFLALLSVSFNFLMKCVHFLIYKHSKYYVVPSISTALSVIGLVLYCLLARWYKRRVRDEDYNAHRVVEEVYDRYLSHAQYRQ